ncbi:hypothetical protein D6D28_07333 [Aureobasidium pullulans]|uniref:Centrosomin N-terminal motif 1 domain-containing protein n=1 Tax=Aureobasidium pullulans TaxID=5580 RepID=A0A4S8SB58_AURPU|nr:hypothetical protein D6D28_07333 [Aureobasidium pullulans]
MTNPASPYLLDRLQARRAIPATRSRRSDSGPRLTGLDDDLFLDEARSSGNDTSVTTPKNRHTPTNATASLGAREIEKRMDKLSKLNFDLKLELFHCRERMAKMQENCKLLASRAEDSNRLVEENATLLDLNDSLVKELEHRDEAVQEAVTIICDLEERLERAQISQQSHHDPPGNLVPPRRSSLSPCPVVSPHKSDTSACMRPSSASPPRRVPSFVGDKKSNARALRSVYLEPTPKLHAVKSFASLMSQREDVDKSVSEVDTLDSPRLSVLSKSSFPSIYDLHRNQDIVEGEANVSQLDAISRNAGNKHDSDSDINSWIQVQTPQPPVLYSGQGQFQQSQYDPDRNQYTSQTTELSHNKQKRTPSLKGSSFGGALLPPTPDSASTSVLQDSYMNGPSDTKVPPRMSANLANAAKHAALLHTPETPSVADMGKLHSRHYTNGPSWSNRHSASLSSTDEEDEYYEQSDSNTNARTGSAGSDGSYPNGGSIVKGTPSRFQVRRKISPARDMLYDGEGARQAPLQRPNTLERGTSQSQNNNNNNNNNRGHRRMERSETTPNLAAIQTPPDSLQRNNSASRPSEMRPQRMERSETTPNLMTSMQVSHWPTPPSFQPGPPIKSQSNNGGGVRAAISQKTNKLLRRMSEHHTSSSDQSSRLGRLSPSKRPNTSTYGGSSGSDDSLAMQAANQAITTRNLVVAPGGSAEAKSPSRSLFSRAAGSLRR